MSENPLSQLLHTLLPRNAEEVSLLHTLLAGARAMHRRAYADLGLNRVETVSSLSLSSVYSASEELLAVIPAADKRYFDGLVEAFEVYHSIHGQAVPQEMASHTLALTELRRIRDLCLQR